MSHLMTDKIAALWPEIVLFITVVIVMLMGTSSNKENRRVTSWVAGLGLFFAFIFARQPVTVDSLMPGMVPFVKPMVCAIGLLLLMGMGTIDRKIEGQFERGRKFDPLHTTQGEYLAFFLLSLIGVMLCTTASDLIWLFLALELTSLPTYIMVATSRSSIAARESAVKYFYLGALAAAIFLYGFALLYGATGTMHLTEMRTILVSQAEAGGLSPLAIAGLLISIIGVSFKIAAVPMHAYVADVYQGAAAPMSAFLAFVPKTAGFIVLMLLLSLVAGLGEGTAVWPESIHAMLWIMAVLSMVVGNTLALLQKNVKRMLAYSSIAHSGYMLVGLVAGPAFDEAAGLHTNGFGAVLFYLLSYGVMNLGTFLVLACLERNGEEIETLADLSGLSRRHPWLSGILAVCALSLLGLPPALGFFGKIYVVFAAGISAGEYGLVIIGGLNSAIAAWYYLQIAGAPWLKKATTESDEVVLTPAARGRRTAAMISAIGVIVMVFFASPLMQAGHVASIPAKIDTVHATQTPAVNASESPVSDESDNHDSH